MGPPPLATPPEGACSLPRRRQAAERQYWGPAAWRVIHWTALHDPARIAGGAWFARLSALLPCEECQEHFQARLAAHPPPDAPSRLLAWSVRMHNSVNAALGKPVVTLAEAKRTFAPPLTWDQVQPLLHSLVATTRKAQWPDLARLVAPLGFPLEPRDLRTRAALSRALLGKPCARDGGRAEDTCSIACALDDKK